MIPQQNLAGLRALMQTPRRQTETAIPEGLQGVIDLQKGLRKLSGQASMMTPEGRPTVAGMLQQAATQQMAPQAQPQGLPAIPNPQMQPQNPGSVAQVAQAAGIAGQQQQQAQQQAMQAAMNMAAQQQAQPTQNMARGGIAMLPADNMARLKYAHGGIIGFDGRGPSYVGEDPIAQSLDDLRVAEAQKRQKIKQLEGQIEFLSQAGAPQAQEKIKELELLKGLRPPTPSIQGKTGDPNRDIGPVQKAMPPAAEPRVAPAVGPRVAPAVGGPRAGGPAAPSGGLAQLIQNMKAPDLAAASAAARGAFPDSAISEQEARIREFSEALKQMPPAQRDYLQSLKDIQARRLKAREQQAGEEGWDRFMAVMSGLGQAGLGGAGRAGAQFTAQQRALGAQQLAEDEAYAQKIGAIVEAQNTQKVNALKAAIEAYGPTIAARGQLNTAIGSLTGQILNTQERFNATQISALASIYQTQVGAESSRLLRQTQTEANKLARVETLLRASTNDYARVSKEIEDQLGGKYGVYATIFQNPEMMKKPENVATYNNYLKDKADMIRSRLDPIQANIKRYQSLVEGMDFGAPPPGAVTKKSGG